MMKQILLPTDFSDNAWNAIFTVLKIYKDIGISPFNFKLH